MIRLNVKVNMNPKDTAQQAQKRLDKAQFALDEQVIKDSNFFAPEDIQELQKSAKRASKPGEGYVAWDTPYARRLYYNPQYEFSTEKNPNARGLWFEEAKAVHGGPGGEWEKAAQDAYNKG